MVSASAWYLWWRVAAGTIPPNPVAWAYFVIECAACGMVLIGSVLCFNGVKRVPTLVRDLSPPATPGELPSVDIFIPSLSEPIDVVERTALAALATDYPGKKTVYILDDGGRRDLGEAVERIAARGEPIVYIAREKPPGVPHHAKAGNLNNAMAKHATGDLVLLIDADHVPERDVLQWLVPYFLQRDEAKHRYRLNSVGFACCPDRSWTTLSGNYLFDDVRLFASTMQQANDAIGAVWLTGTAVLMRRTALDEIGGFYRGSITEDVPTGFLMLAQGWESRYHSRPVSRGMPPVSLIAALKQRERWFIGEIQQFWRLFVPDLLRRLGWRQKLSYLYGAVMKIASTFCFYGYAVMPMIAALAGKATRNADPVADAIHVGAYVAVGRLYTLAVARQLPPSRIFRMEQMTFLSTAAMIVAAFRVLFGLGTNVFWVSPKTRARVSGIWGYVLIATAMFVPFAAACWFILRGITWPRHFTMPAAGRWVGLVWQFNLALLLWPMFAWGWWRPRVCADYHEEPLEEPKLPWWRHALGMIMLPTNIAPALTVAACIGTIIAQPVGPNVHAPPRRSHPNAEVIFGSPGRIVWHELIAHDPKAAEEFYGKVVGWEIDDHDAYWTWTSSKGPVAGMFRMLPEVRAQGVPPTWVCTFTVDDIDDAIDRAVANGGKVYEPPTEWPNGIYAMIGDFHGAAIYLTTSDVQAREGPPFFHGDFSWNDLATTDLEPAMRFYSTLFGWTPISRSKGPDGVYAVMGARTRPIAGIFAAPGLPHGWTFYIEVSDLDAALDRARKAGGTIITGPLDLPLVRQAVLRDNQGAVVGLRQMRPFPIESATEDSSSAPDAAPTQDSAPEP